MPKESKKETNEELKKAPVKSAPKKEYVYEAKQPDKNGELQWIRLTKEELDYRNDKVVSAILNLSDEYPPAYRKMASLRAIRHYIDNSIPTVKEEYERFKKRGLI